MLCINLTRIIPQFSEYLFVLNISLFSLCYIYVKKEHFMSKPNIFSSEKECYTDR